MSRRYYSMRTGKHPQAAGCTLDMMLRFFITFYERLSNEGYFQEAFGYGCVDAGLVPGTLGPDVSATVSLKLRKDDLWPIHERYHTYSEDDLFDIIEFLYDHVSAPVDGTYHNFCDCGWHYDSFDRTGGQKTFLERINTLLATYQGRFELSEEGEILRLGEVGLEPILKADPLTFDPKNVDDRVAAAIRKFRSYRSTLEDRRDAVRDLADVLEFLRPEIKQVLTSKDERDLFNMPTASAYATTTTVRRRITDRRYG